MNRHPGGEAQTLYLLENIEWKKEMKALDLGAGEGDTIRILKSLGMDAHGVDLFPRGSDVERVLSDYRENQEAIFDEETKELVTRSRLGNVTFWVRFVETEEGYLVRRAYSHRMNIMKRVGQ